MTDSGRFGRSVMNDDLIFVTLKSTLFYKFHLFDVELIFKTYFCFILHYRFHLNVSESSLETAVRNYFADLINHQDQRLFYLRYLLVTVFFIYVFIFWLGPFSTTLLPTVKI